MLFGHSGYSRQFELPGPSVQGRGIKFEILQKSSRVCFIWLKTVWKTKFHCPGLVRTINSALLGFLAILGICGISSWRASFVQARGVKYWCVDDCVIQIEDYCTPTNHILKLGCASLWLWEILSSEMPFLHLFAWGSLFTSLQIAPRVHRKYCKIVWKYILSLTGVMYDS